MGQWYYASAGQAQGPVDDDGLRRLAYDGTLDPTSLVVPVGGQQWSPLAQHEAALGLARDTAGRYSITAAAEAATGAPPAAAAPPPAPGAWATPGGVTPAPGGYGPPPGGYAPPPAGYGTPAPGYGAPAVIRPVSDFGRTLADWWKRAIALIIDWLIIGIPLNILSAVAGGWEFRERADGTLEVNAGLGPFMSVLGLVVYFLYFGLLNGGPRGQTLGKMVFRIQVRDATTGGEIGIGKGFLRILIQFLLSLPCGIPLLIDYLSPLWDKKRQAWHDKAVSSVVVDVE